LSNDITPIEDTSVSVSGTVQMLQRVGVLCTKAALQQVWWAGLAFDIGQTAVEFGYSRQTERLLNRIGARIDALEDGARERLKADEVYQLSAQAAIRCMLMEINPRMAEALARAVVELGVSDLEPGERMEVARGLDALTEPALHLLQMQYRAQHDLLTEPELQAVDGDVKKPMRFMALMYSSMRLTSWLAPTLELERAGLIAVTLDNGTFAEAHTATMAIRGQVVHLQDVYPAGERVLRMCFDDPAVPAFGAYAVQPAQAPSEREP